LKEASASFLKKRSKKLLLVAGLGRGVATTTSNQSFFASFCSQKEGLACFLWRFTGRVGVGQKTVLSAARLWG
jgi:hypothetical protein